MLLHQRVPKLLEMCICKSAAFIYLGIQLPSTHTVNQMVAFWNMSFTTTSTLPLAPVECRTGILIRFNHNSHNNKSTMLLSHPQGCCAEQKWGQWKGWNERASIYLKMPVVQTIVGYTLDHLYDLEEKSPLIHLEWEEGRESKKQVATTKSKEEIRR